jgi:hypothetical protein
MRAFSALILLAIGTAIVGAAAGPLLPSTPEIDPATGGSALAVLAGALVILRGRRKR